MTSQRMRGFALMAVVSLLLALGVISYLLILQGGQGSNQNRSLSDRDTAAYLAEAAIAHAKWQAQATSCGTYVDLPTTSLGDHQYSATLAAYSGSPISITATGTTADGASATITREEVKVYASTQTVTYNESRDLEDTYLEDTLPTTNYGNAPYFQLSNDVAGLEHAILKFDLKMIPPDAYVSSATLTLNLESIGIGTSGTLYAYRLTQDWNESQTTWNEYKTSQSWSNAGGDKHDQIWASAPINSGGGSVTLNVTNLINAWTTNKTDNFGILLAVSSNLTDAQFSSSEHASVSLRPSLDLKYACECGLPCVPSQLFYRDEFYSFTCTTNTDYTNTDGTIDWSAQQWDESETDDSCAGDIQLQTDLADTRLRMSGDGRRISRELTLDVFTTPRLSFAYRRENLNRNNQYVTVEVSLDTTTWTELGRITGPGTDAAYVTQSYDLTPYNGNLIYIRFSSRRLSNFFSRYIYIDDVQIDDGISGGGDVTVDIVANADTWIYDRNPNTNYGSDNALRTGRQGGGGNYSRALMYFDIAADVPAGATIVAVNLGLQIVANRGFGVMTTSIYRLDIPWVENADTWNSLGGGSWEASSLYTGDFPNSQVWLNLPLATNLIQEWLDNTFVNQGLIFVYSDATNRRREFASIEDGDPTIHPVLSITYTPP